MSILVTSNLNSKLKTANGDLFSKIFFFIFLNLKLNNINKNTK